MKRIREQGREMVDELFLESLKVRGNIQDTVLLWADPL
jgi:hypothetical protein